MRRKHTALIGVTFLAKKAFSGEEPSKVNLYGEYSYLRLDPTLTGSKNRNAMVEAADSRFFGKYLGA